MRLLTEQSNGGPGASTSSLPPLGFAGAGGRAAGVLLMLALACFTASRALTLGMPLERDEGEYAYIAQRLLAGETPYLDQFNQKTPGIVGVYGVVFTLFGESVIAIHAALALGTLLTGAMLWRVVERLGGGFAAAWATLIYALLSIDPRLLASAANTEHFANLGLTLAALALVEWRFRPAWWLAGSCGLGLAAACAFKQVAILPASWLGLFWLAAILRPRKGVPARGLAHLCCFAGGAALVVVPIVGFFIARGAWSAFLDGVLMHNLSYIQRNTGEEALRALSRAAQRQWPALTIPALGAALAVLAGRTGSTRLLIGWLVAAFAATATSLNFYDHYSIWLAPPLCALAGIGMAGLVERAGRGHGRRLTWIAAAVGFSVVLVAALTNASFWFAATAEDRVRQAYGQSLCVEGRQLAEHIRTSGGPEDSVLILGSEPQILFYAQRRSRTRYIIMYPLFGPYADALGRQEEVIREIAQAPPDWIIEVQLWSSRTPDPACPRILEAAVAALINAGPRYELDGLAIPRAGERRYDLKFGDDARALGERARKAAAGGVLIYRRVK